MATAVDPLDKKVEMCIHEKVSGQSCSRARWLSSVAPAELVTPDKFRDKFR